MKPSSKMHFLSGRFLIPPSSSFYHHPREECWMLPTSVLTIKAEDTGITSLFFKVGWIVFCSFLRTEQHMVEQFRLQAYKFSFFRILLKLHCITSQRWYEIHAQFTFFHFSQIRLLITVWKHSYRVNSLFELWKMELDLNKGGKMAQVDLGHFSKEHPKAKKLPWLLTR